VEPEILILAAGSSSRMRGADKLLEEIEGIPLLRRVALAALATGLPVSVTLPPASPLRQAALAGLETRPVVVKDPESGMSESLKAGLDAIAPGRPVLLLLADLPELTSDDLATMLVNWHESPDLILRGAAADGTPGHPVCLPAWVRPDLAALSGDTGARDILRTYHDRTQLVSLPGRHAITDLDTPEDWAAWRASHRQ
jgi:molybdenum cofactor cytidylyltransferase